MWRGTVGPEVRTDFQLMLMKSWQQQGLKREPMMQGERPNAVAVLFLHAHKLALPESCSMSQRAPTWIIGQDSVCIWYVVSPTGCATSCSPVASRDKHVPSLRRKKQTLSLKEAHMTSIADGSVHIQTSSESVPSTPSWFGEVVLMATHLGQHNVLAKISERVRFARRRFGHDEVIDFLAVLFGYAISGERTLEAFYERRQPFAVPFMAGAGA